MRKLLRNKTRVRKSHKSESLVQGGSLTQEKVQWLFIISRLTGQKMLAKSKTVTKANVSEVQDQ